MVQGENRKSGEYNADVVLGSGTTLDSRHAAIKKRFNGEASLI
jgi:hypothetical protein